MQIPEDPRTLYRMMSVASLYTDHPLQNHDCSNAKKPIDLRRFLEQQPFMISDVSRRRNSVIDLFQVDYVGKEKAWRGHESEAVP